jgi:hypothetical protein
VNLLKTILARALLALSLFAPTLRAEEQSILTALSSTTLTGYVNTSSIWSSTGVVFVIGPDVSYDPPPGEEGTVAPSPEPIPDPVPVLPAPINDAFSTAIEVGLGRVSLPEYLPFATLESAEPSIADQTGSLWFRWTVPETGVARVSTKELFQYLNPSAQSYFPALSDEPIFYPWGGISYDGSEGENENGGGFGVITQNPGTVGPVYRPFNLAAYRGDSLPNLALIARGWELEFQAAAGETIWISFETFERDDGFWLAGSLPQYFWVDLTPPPSNDSFDSALIVSETSGGSFGGHFLGSTRQDAEPNLGGDFFGPSVWFGFTASIHGPVTLNGLTINSADFPIAVFTGADLDHLQLVAKGKTFVTFAGEPGKRYHIAAYAGRAGIRDFGISYTAPRYRLYTTTVNDLMPAGQQPHFYGLRGSTILLYAKSATGWDCVEIEPIVNFATDLLIRPANAVDGQLRVITIDETLPAPHIQLRPARGVLIPDVIGYPGQTCAISYSTDLINWSTPQIRTLTSAPLSLAAISSAAPTHFFRVTQSLPQPVSPPVLLQPEPPAPETQTGGSYGAHMQLGNGSRNIPAPPVPGF